MNGNEHKGWQIKLQPRRDAEGWRISVVLTLEAGQFHRERSFTDERVFPTKREAEQAGLAVARAWIDDRAKNPSLKAAEASERLLSLQMKTYLLREAVRHLREEAEAEIESRKRQQRPLTDPPYDFQGLIGGMGVLEAGISKAMDEVKGYSGGSGGTMFGEPWLRDMEDRMRREGEQEGDGGTISS